MNAKEIRKKYGKDPMFQLLDLHLWISLEGLAKKQKGLISDNTGYILERLKDLGFKVTKSNSKSNLPKRKRKYIVNSI